MYVPLSGFVEVEVPKVFLATAVWCIINHFTVPLVSFVNKTNYI